MTDNVNIDKLDVIIRRINDAKRKAEHIKDLEVSGMWNQAINETYVLKRQLQNIIDDLSGIAHRTDGS